MEKFNLGIDIGGTFIKYALMDKQYRIKDKWKIETIKYDTADEFYDYICSNIKLIDDTFLCVLFLISSFIFVPYIMATLGAAYDLTFESLSMSPGALIPITSISSINFMFEHI